MNKPFLRDSTFWPVQARSGHKGTAVEQRDLPGTTCVFAQVRRDGAAHWQTAAAGLQRAAVRSNVAAARQPQQTDQTLQNNLPAASCAFWLSVRLSCSVRCPATQQAIMLGLPQGYSSLDPDVRLLHDLTCRLH